MVRKFGAAARRVQQAGFDAIEVHAGHSYLLNQFLSPYYNKREDEYGGSPENPARLAKEVIAEVRKNVGPNSPISVRLQGEVRHAGHHHRQHPPPRGRGADPRLRRRRLRGRGPRPRRDPRAARCGRWRQPSWRSMAWPRVCP
ncbi:hypothetical protein [Actinomyces radicidentis]|uniref:oxidoreductase n=1 Tax=Actinomyces radicidentis TaxID=111015 RepID=UPI0022B26B8C|nr:hypothetical protein [Actinomyces radicidentis]